MVHSVDEREKYMYHSHMCCHWHMKYSRVENISTDLVGRDLVGHPYSLVPTGPNFDWSL